jgi:polysaccharide pyruvyl transferase WcaK-like protein
MYNILVYGWYYKNNIGDDLFVESFKNIFPDFNFIFVDHFLMKDLQNCDAVFIGAGSFLDNSISIENGAMEILLNKKIFYIGVGNETIKSKDHLLLMSKAKLIAFRKSHNHDLIDHNNVITIPDIVYSVKNKIQLSNKKNKSVLILPNSVLIPQNADAHWKFSAWDYFKSEFSQFLDHLIDDGYMVKFYSMCNNNRLADMWAATEINNLMKNRRQDNLLAPNLDPKNIFNLISEYETIITQRYHGIILSEICERKYLAIHHHDKLKSNDNAGSFISFFNLNKHLLLEKFYSDQNYNQVLPIELDLFISLKNKVLNILSE